MKRSFRNMIIVGGMALALGACSTSASNGGMNTVTTAANSPTAAIVATASSTASSEIEAVPPSNGGDTTISSATLTETDNSDTTRAVATATDNAATTNVAGIENGPYPAPSGDTSGNTPPSGGTSGNAPPSGGAPGGGVAQRSPGVMGEVVSVSDSSITVQDQMQDSTTVVALTTSTEIFKQESITIADVAVGSTVQARGSLDGDTFTATQVQVRTADESETVSPDGGTGGGMGQPGGMGGGPGGMGGGMGGGGTPPEPVGTPPAGSEQTTSSDTTTQPAGSPGDHISGTVEAVTDDTITLTTADGSTVAVVLATDGEIVQRVAGTTDDLSAGVWVRAMGELSDSTLTATRIDIVPEMQQP